MPAIPRGEEIRAGPAEEDTTPITPSIIYQRLAPE